MWLLTTDQSSGVVGDIPNLKRLKLGGSSTSEREARLAGEELRLRVGEGVETSMASATASVVLAVSRGGDGEASRRRVSGYSCSNRSIMP